MVTQRKAIEQLKNLTVGHVGFGLRGTAPGTPRQQVHDGDTINVRAIGNFDIRFLGIDAAEISFTLPSAPNRFIPLSDQRWEDYLSAPFVAGLPIFSPALDDGLQTYLQEHVGPGTAQNHARYATAAREALAAAIMADMEKLGKTKEDFAFFLVFANEIMDRYGRLLCFINRDQPDSQTPEPRPLSYNERLLQTAIVVPYFIWPNIDPFRKESSLLIAVIKPGQAATLANGNNRLADARRWLLQARAQQRGIFDATDPLRLLPFEVRYLGRRTPPDRWVIDLSKNDNVLLKPQNYYTIPHMEDRLFIPAEYVPLFVECGWHRQA